MFVVESAGITDVGRKRKNNEDALFIDDEQSIYVVADGMGGHQAGEVASMMVVDTIRDYMARTAGTAPAAGSADTDETLSDEANRLVSSIRLANQGVHEAANSRQRLKGMGATVSAVMFTRNTMIVANVGDSPVYLVHNGSIEQLSVTHNVITEQEAIDPDAVYKIGEQYRHMLTRAMGLQKTVDADVLEIPFFQGDKVVISSDGLSDMVSPEEILEVVADSDPQQACRALVDLANDRGGRDNVTVIALDVTSVTHHRRGIAGLVSRLISPFTKLFS